MALVACGGDDSSPGGTGATGGASGSSGSSSAGTSGTSGAAGAATGGTAGAGGAATGGSAGAAGAGGAATGGSAGAGGAATGGSAGAAGAGGSSSDPICSTPPTPTGACDGVLPGTSVRMCTEYYETMIFPIATQQTVCGAGTYTEGGSCPTTDNIGHCLVTLDYPAGPYATKSLFYYDPGSFSVFKDSCDMPGAAGSTKTWCGP